MWELEKCSMPEWTKQFSTEADAVAELRAHICGDCMSGRHGYVDSQVPGGIAYETVEPPDPNSARDLLSTPCGCEYHINPPA